MGYRLYKTAYTTAKNNGLEFIKTGDNRYLLFDFSNFSQLDELKERELQFLKDEAIKYIRGYNCVLFSGKSWDNFESCDLEAHFNKLRIFSRQGKLLYEIFEMKEIAFYRKERNSVYEREYQVKKIEKILKTNTDTPSKDIEIQ